MSEQAQVCPWPVVFATTLSLANQGFCDSHRGVMSLFGLSAREAQV